MSIRKILAFIVNKVYYFGAFVVICGLICQNLGLESAKKVTIIGLFFEAAIFFFGMFNLEEPEEDKNKKEEEDKNKKIYYTDGNGNYYLKNPTLGIQGGVLPMGGGQGNANMRLPYNYNGDYVNGSNESYYMPDINSDIKQLKEKIDFLESLRKKQIHNLTAGGYFDNTKNEEVNISKTSENNNIQLSGVDKNTNSDINFTNDELKNSSNKNKEENSEENLEENVVKKGKRGRKPKNPKL